jgi:outer membrane protein assembly factor BamB
MSIRRASTALWLALMGLISVPAPSARAEMAVYDCGVAGAYEPNAAWPRDGGCNTGLGQTKAFGPNVIVDKDLVDDPANPYVWQKAFLNSPVTAPAISANSTIIFGVGVRTAAVRENGTVIWDKSAGAHVKAAPAIGVDGTVYVGTALGVLRALDQRDGSTKWTLDLGDAEILAGIVLGPNKRIYVTDAAGKVFAVTDAGTSGTLVWTHNLGGAIDQTPAMSRDATTLYVGNRTGRFRALDVSNGVARWTAAASIGQGSTPVVLRNGKIVVGSSDGKLYGVDPTNGATSFSTNLGGAVRSPAVFPSGNILVYSRIDDLGDRLNEVSGAGAIVWRATTPQGVPASTFPPTSTPLIEPNGNIYRCANAMCSSTNWPTKSGWAASLGTAQGSIIHLAMTHRGSLIILETNKYGQGSISSHGPGADPHIGAQVSRRVRLDDGSLSGGNVAYCTGTADNDQRPGMTYKMMKRVNGVLTECASRTDTTCKMTAVQVTATQEGVNGCPVTFCNDDEVAIPLADGKALLADPANGTPPTSASYTDNYCDATSADECEAIKPSSVVWATTCVDSSQCGTGKLCALTCPKDSATNLPKLECLPEQQEAHCAQVDTARCPGLAAVSTTATPKCHELRECADAEDKATEAEITPVCVGPDGDNRAPGEGGLTDHTAAKCNTTSNTGTTPTLTGVSTANFPGFDLWAEATDGRFCSVAQPEKARASDNGGKSADSARKSKKKWGLWLNADVSSNFDVEPKPFGFFLPKATADANFAIMARVMGKEITVLGALADASLQMCQVQAASSLKLFNQTIHGVEASLPTVDEEGGTKCEEFFTEVEEAIGEVKHAMVAAARMHSLIKDAGAALGNKAFVTKDMCHAILSQYDQFGRVVSVDPICNAPNLTKANATKIANAYIARYNTMVSGLNAKISALKSQYITPYINQMGSFQKNAGAGRFEKDMPILPDIGSEFNIVGASVSFPIGPVALTLEIQGSGEWGIDGYLNYGAQLLPLPGGEDPGFWARARVEPFLHVDVDVFMGVGFEYGVAGASAGIGGVITLVDIRAPVSGGANLRMSAREMTSSEKESRAWPASLTRFKASDFHPSLKQMRYEWKNNAEMQAAAQLTALSGSLDIRLRVKFLFVTKTWKKRIAQLKGKTWTFAWKGEVNLPIALPPVNLPVLDSLPFPSIPTLAPIDFNFPEVGWPTASQYTDAATRAHASILTDQAFRCEGWAPL